MSHGQAVVADLPRRGTQRPNFGVGRGIDGANRLIESRRHDRLVYGDDGAHGHLVVAMAFRASTSAACINSSSEMAKSQAGYYESVAAQL